MSLSIVKNNVTPSNQCRIIRNDALPGIVGLSKSTIYRLVKMGKFPSPFKLSSQSVGFDLGEIETWMQERKASRPNMKQPGGA